MISSPQVAKDLIGAGLSVIPIQTNGTKKPDIDSWAQYQKQPADKKEVGNWFRISTPGLAVICGEVSGGLTVIDFDAPELIEPWKQAVIKSGHGDLLTLLPMVRTPDGGLHIYARCIITGRNQKLAERLGSEGKTITLIETRANGGYVLSPFCPASCHPTGREYEALQGDLRSGVPVIQPEELEALLEAARSFDEIERHQKRHQPITNAAQNEAPKESASDRPGDVFNAKATWGDVLAPIGWTEADRTPTETRYQRPGSDKTSGAVYLDTDKLHVYTTKGAPLESGQSYTKFSAYTAITHGGNFSEAARAIKSDSRFFSQIEQKAENKKANKPDAPFWSPPVMWSSESKGPAIPPDVLPSYLASYAKTVAEATQTPPELAVMLILAVLATCQQGKIEISPGGDYVEPVSLWTCTVLPPASRKTAVFNLATAPLKEWEKKEALRMAPEVDLAESRRAVIESRMAEIKKKAAKAENKDAREKLIKDMTELKSVIPPEIHAPMLFTGDITPEALQGRMADNGERMAILSDEGGIFEVMTGLYNDGKVNLDVFLQSHAGSSCRVNRAGREVILEKPALSFGLTVQPDIVSELGIGSKRKLRGNGCLARFLYCVPESNIGNRDVRKRKEISAHVSSQYALNIGLMLNIKTECDSYGKPLPIRLGLDEIALNKWHDFGQEIENRQGKNGDLEHISDWTGKLPGAVLRIAALCHVAEFGAGGAASKVVNNETMERAVKLAWLLLEHAKIAFELTSVDPTMSDAKYLAEWIRKQGQQSFPKRDAHKLGRFNNSKVDRLQKALDILVERSIVVCRTVDTRKPTTLYDVNPAFLS